ncbi:MAG: CoA transferase [Pseudomonadales bacterium]|jgi:formyl-CoA transferase|nr:CoA transferase [Pseudomonadales bacterium]MDP6471728.1 CoA transferase [Pseudomonadales bacterium]MDP6971440.1 CoA transferase [Pseudomonadales bacterium]
MPALFADLKVIDGASFLAGPCAATILSDYGADVVKIEPLSGDQQRSIAAGHPSDYSWQLTDRNRRSLAMDITTGAGREVLLRMLKKADVFVVNFSAQQLDRYDLDWETLRAVNPRLIFAQISGYGLEGPESARRAFDFTAWFARTGILDMMHEKDVAPSMPAGGVGDHATSMTLFAGIMMALYKRDRTGEGSMVSTSLVATGAWANGLNLQGVMAGVDTAARRDQEGWSNPVQGVYRTADERFVLIVIQNVARDWPKLVYVLERTQWLDDERFQPVKPLFRNRFLAREMIGEALANIDSSELCRRLDEAGIVHSLVMRNAEVLEDPQLLANGVLLDSEAALPGGERTFATPIKLSSEGQLTPQRAPGIGEHSAEILREYDISAAEIGRLKAEGVVGGN